MTVGDLRVAIRQMLRPPHPRARSAHWLVIAVTAALALLVQLLVGWDWLLFGAVAGGLLLAAAVFTLLGRLWGWVIVSVGLGFLLGIVPLFGVLGLELSIVTALFASIMAADLGSGIARVLGGMPILRARKSVNAGRTLVRGALASAALAMLIASIPGVIAAIRGIFVPTCDWEFGIISYVAMPLASAALFGAAGHALGALVGPVRVLGAAVAQMPALVVAVAATVRFYAAPPVYTYNAVLGYFPGNMYDENVRLTSTLVWSRLEQAAWVVAIVALVALRFDVANYRAKLRSTPQPHGRRLGTLAVAVAGLVFAVALRCNGGRLGFTVDAEDLVDALGGRKETAHFVIYYSRTAEIEKEIDLIAADHELRFHQVTQQLGVVPEEKIVSFYFADREEKYRLHGSRDVEMAKPWRGEIYLEHRPFPHSSLRHEIAHAVAAEFGDWLWGVAAKPVAGMPILFSPGLIEGLAVAVDWPGSYDRPNPHESVRIIQALGKEPSISQLLGLQFFSYSSAQGYQTAGSFLRFLLDTYGPAKVRELYRSGGDFEGVFNVPRSQLELEWRQMLSTVAVSDEVVEAQKERFRAVSVFSKRCPHAIAKAVASAHEALGEGDREGAIELMRDVCRDSAGEPRYRNTLGTMLAIGSGAEQLEAIQLWTSVALDDKHVTTQVRAQALNQLARAAGRRRDYAHARHVIGYALTLAIEPDSRRELEAMAFALDHQGPAAGQLRDYFFPPRDATTDGLTYAEAAAAVEPTLGLAHYLVGLQHHARGEYQLAANAFELAFQRGLPSVLFVKNAARRLAVAAYRAKDRKRLELATSTLTGPGMTSGDKLLAKDWLDRVAFDAM